LIQEKTVAYFIVRIDKGPNPKILTLTTEVGKILRGKMF
jgi:hypothetical protein